MPRPPSRTKQLLDPMAAFQMVHVMEGVIHARHRDRAARPQPAAVRQDRHDQRSDQRVVRRRHARYRRRGLSRLRQSAADGPLCAGRADLGADLQAMGPDRAQGPAEGAVRRARRHPLGADRPRHRQGGLWRVPDDRGRQVAGDLGSVPAADRAPAAAYHGEHRRSVQPATQQQRHPAISARRSCSNARLHGAASRPACARRPRPRRRSRRMRACQAGTRSFSGC